MKSGLFEIGEANHELENIRLKLEEVIGVTKVCAVTFEHSDAFASVSEEETANAFFSIHSQLEDINKSLSIVITAMCKNVKKAYENEPEAG